MNTSSQISRSSKNRSKLTGGLLALRLFRLSSLPCLVALGMHLAVAQEGQELSEKISDAAVFYQPLVWVGKQPPSEAENRELWGEVQDVMRNPGSASLEGLERFITSHPSSPWVPSIRANLGRFDYEHGLYSKALDHWQAAWQATHQEPSGSGKTVADFAFAYWTKLLASLGRIDTLRDLFAETQGRVFDGGQLQHLVDNTKEGYHMMLSNPGICFKCGTFALMNVGRELKGRSFDVVPIDKIPSPLGGFDMATVMKLAANAGLEMVSASWGDEKSLVVP